MRTEQTNKPHLQKIIHKSGDGSVYGQGVTDGDVINVVNEITLATGLSRKIWENKDS